jgi:hypothetical protein
MAAMAAVLAGSLIIPLGRAMSALGQKRTFSEVCVMSVLLPKADIVRAVDIRKCQKADS